MVKSSFLKRYRNGSVGLHLCNFKNTQRKNKCLKKSSLKGYSLGMLSFSFATLKQHTKTIIVKKFLLKKYEYSHGLLTF